MIARFTFLITNLATGEMEEAGTISGRPAAMWRRELWKLRDRIAESQAGEGLQQFLKQQQVKKRVSGMNGTMQ